MMSDSFRARTHPGFGSSIIRERSEAQGHDCKYLQDLTVHRIKGKWKLFDLESKQVKTFDGVSCGPSFGHFAHFDDLYTLLQAPPAAAQSKPICIRAECVVVSKEPGVNPIRGGTRSAHVRQSRLNSADDEAFRAAQKEYDASLTRYGVSLQAYVFCMSSPVASACGAPPILPHNPALLDGPGLITTAVPLVTGAQAAAMVVARLQLPTISPEIGPSPALNEWKMAAVGYPLWLWAGGRTHVGPVTDTAGGLSVSLDARVSRLSFRMGDGHVVRCAGTGRRWTASVKPGTASPTCGYRYTRPSLPRGSYTVTAVTTWSVRWTSNGDSGVIVVPAVATTKVPVGELQILVR